MMRLKLSNGAFTILDVNDFNLVKRWTWRQDKYGYATRVKRTYLGKGKYKCTTLFLHRELLQAVKGTDVDHINHNRLDNRRENLRLATRSQNNMNSALKRRNTSGIRGVNWHKETKKWRAYINKSGKQIYLGLFNDIEDAIAARREKAKELYGDFINE